MQKQTKQSGLEKVIEDINILFKVPWLGLLNLIFNIYKRVTDLIPSDGLYEVVEYETTLELHDRQGKKATVSKQQKVRYLQNHIIAYQDQAWGDGEILVDYKCTPGIPVDQYRFGHKTIILISLREETKKDEIDDIHIIWKMKNGFTTNKESWGTAIQHKTKRLTINIIFPKSRPPVQISLIEGQTKPAKKLSDGLKRQLPDGRWQVTWQCKKPKINVEYLLEWKW